MIKNTHRKAVAPVRLAVAEARGVHRQNDGLIACIYVCIWCWLFLDRCVFHFEQSILQSIPYSIKSPTRPLRTPKELERKLPILQDVQLVPKWAGRGQGRPLHRGAVPRGGRHVLHRLGGVLGDAHDDACGPIDDRGPNLRGALHDRLTTRGARWAHFYN